MDYPSGTGASPPYIDSSSSSSSPSPVPGARIPLQITTAAPSSHPVTAASYIPGPGPSIPPQSAGPSQPTASPLFASLGPSSSSPVPPISIPSRALATPAPASNAAVISGVPPAAAPIAPAQNGTTTAAAAAPASQAAPPTDPNAEPHSFDDCPACRAEYAAAVAASLNADAERKRIDEERERREIEDAIRLSQQEENSRPTRTQYVSQQEEEELMRRAIEESTRNAAEEEERRRQWRHTLQTSLGEGSSSASRSNQPPIDEDEVLKRVLEESARAEEEAAKRREQVRQWEANAMDKSKRAAELEEQQRYLEVQEASMWRAPGGSSSSAQTEQPSADPSGNENANADESIKKGGEKEDLSLDLGLRASRKSQELPAGIPQEEFARVIAEEVRQRQNQRQDGQTQGDTARHQLDESSFWRNPGDAGPPRPLQSAAPLPSSRAEPDAEPSPTLVANVNRLVGAAAEAGDDLTQSVSLPPLMLGTSSNHDYGIAETSNGVDDDQSSIAFPQSAVDTVPPSAVDTEPAGTQTIAEEEAAAPAVEHVVLPALSAHTSLPRPLPIPPGPSPTDLASPQLISAPSIVTDENTDSIDSTLAERLRSAVALETQLDSHLNQLLPVKPTLQLQPQTSTAPPQPQLQPPPPSAESSNSGPLGADLHPDVASSQSIAGDEPDVPRPDADAPVDADAFSLSESYAESELRPSIATPGAEPSLRSAEGGETSTLDETDVMETNPLRLTDAPPLYAAVDPDPDASSRTASVLSHASPASAFPASPLDSGGAAAAATGVGTARPGSGSGSGLLPGGGRVSRASSGASSAAGTSNAANARLSYVGGMVGTNPLLSGLSYNHNPVPVSSSSLLSGPRRSSGNAAFSAGGLGTGVGGNAFVQSGSAVQPVGQGRWSGEPQIAVALRRTSAANAAAGPTASSSSTSSGGRNSFTSSHRASMHGSSPPAPATTATFNPLFTAFGEEAEDADRSASAAAANAPRLPLPREHIGGWAAMSIQTSPPAPGPAAFPHSPSGPQQQGYLSGSGSMQFSPESSPSATASSPPGASSQQDGLASKSKKNKLKSFFSRHERASSKASNRLSFLGGGSSSSSSGGGVLETVVPYGSGGQSMDFAPERPIDDSVPAIREAPLSGSGRTRSSSRQGRASSLAGNKNAASSRTSLGSAFSNHTSGQTYPTYGLGHGGGFPTSPGQETVEELQDSASALS